MTNTVEFSTTVLRAPSESIVWYCVVCCTGGKVIIAPHRIPQQSSAPDQQGQFCINSETLSDTDTEIGDPLAVMELHKEIPNSDLEAASDRNALQETNVYQSSVNCAGNCYPCSICGKVFIEQKDRDTHKQQHTGGKRYKCSTCFKGFGSPKALKSHSNVHSCLLYTSPSPRD